LPRGRSRIPRVACVRGVGCGSLGGSAAGGGWFVGAGHGVDSVDGVCWARSGRLACSNRESALAVPVAVAARSRSELGRRQPVQLGQRGGSAGDPQSWGGGCWRWSKGHGRGLVCFAPFVGFRVTVVHVAGGGWGVGVVSAVVGASVGKATGETVTMGAARRAPFGSSGGEGSLPPPELGQHWGGLQLLGRDVGKAGL
jgi:hypothetical protein